MDEKGRLEWLVITTNKSNDKGWLGWLKMTEMTRDEWNDLDDYIWMTKDD